MARGLPIRRQLDFALGAPAVFALGLTRARRRMPEPVETILILANPTIGDTVLMTGPIQDLAAHFGGAAITLVAGRENKIMTPHMPHVSGVMLADYTSPITFIKKIRRNSYDLLMDFGTWPRISAICSALSMAAFTVGFDTPGQHRHFAYDLGVSHRPDRHELENQRALVEAVIGKPSTALPSLVHVSNPAPEDRIEPPYVIFHAWASGSGKRLKEWPNAHWAELASAVAADGRRIVLTGGPNDLRDGEALFASLSDRVQPGTAVNLTGRLSFAALLDCIDDAAAVVSVNTGIMHAAAARNARVLALNGPTNPARWGPVGPRTVALTPPRGEHSYLNLGYEFPRGASYSLGHLTPEEVYGQLRMLIG